jgi:hypothetical protein
MQVMIQKEFKGFKDIIVDESASVNNVTTIQKTFDLFSQKDSEAESSTTSLLTLKLNFNVQSQEVENIIKPAIDSYQRQIAGSPDQ